MKLTKVLTGLIAVAAMMIPAATTFAGNDYAYRVQAGESWATIARKECRQGVQASTLARYNGVAETATPTGSVKIPFELSKKRTAKIQASQGSVTVDGAAATRGQFVAENQTIVTAANGRVEVVLDNGSVMRIGPNTRLKMTGLTLSGRDQNTSTELQSGSVTMQVTRMNRNSSFSVSTVSAVAGVRGTYFYVNYDENSKDVGIACYTGKVIVGRTKTDEAGNTVIDETSAVDVNQGFATTITGGSGAVAQPFPIPGKIEWVE